MVMIRISRLEWFGHVKRRDETENIRRSCGNEDGVEAPWTKT